MNSAGRAHTIMKRNTCGTPAGSGKETIKMTQHPRHHQQDTEFFLDKSDMALQGSHQTLFFSEFLIQSVKTHDATTTCKSVSNVPRHSRHTHVEQTFQFKYVNDTNELQVQKLLHIQTTVQIFRSEQNRKSRDQKMKMGPFSRLMQVHVRQIMFT